MIGYHASWFANDAGLVAIDFEAVGWRVYQRAVAGTFFFLVGVSTQLAGSRGFRPFALRCARVAGCSIVVTLTSVVLDPTRVVTFGILQAITVCSLIAWPLRRLNLGAALGGLVLIAATAVHDPRFSAPALAWTGLGATVAPTFDFQPLVPWLGVVLLGLAAGSHLAALPKTLGSPLCGSEHFRALRAIGRHSLFVYMAHVPVLGGIMQILARMRS